MIDSLLSLTLDLNRLDAGTRKKVLRLLKSMQTELTASLMSTDLTAFQRARQAGLLKQAKTIIERYYARLDGVSSELLSAVSEVTVKETASAITQHLPASMEATIPQQKTIEAMMSDTLIMGAPASEWWSRQGNDTVFRYSAAVRQGLAQGETNQQIASRIRDVVTTSMRNARSLVQTSVASVSNAARQSTFEENNDVIKGYKWISALDSRVCDICIALSDKEWQLGGKPIGHGIPFRLPPVHFNDRCIVTAITKSFKELGFPEIKEPKPGQRASEDGPISSKTTFEKFLEKKGEAWQDEVLGKGRAELWRKGEITLENLIDGTLKPLTVKELKSKYV